MKTCAQCRQQIGEDVNNCPICGAETPFGRTHVDSYKILQFFSEGPGSITYKAQGEGEASPVLIRLFKPESGINPEKALRLQKELELLHTLPPAKFVRHFGIHQSSQGEWYRVSEWLDVIAWGDLIGSGYFLDLEKAFAFMATIAEGLSDLHSLGCCIPHLTSDDLVPMRTADGSIAVKIDYKLSRFIDPNLPNLSSRMSALISVHPDILKQIPLDTRTDVWSLGRIFLVLLTGRDELKEAVAALDELSIPMRIKRLIGQMLEEDPGLRPESMDEVAKRLRSVTSEELAENRNAAKNVEDRLLRSRMKWIAAIIVLIILAGGSTLFLQYKYAFFSHDTNRLLSMQAEKYRGSVAFVACAYALKSGGKTLYIAGGTGTAFLVSEDGYLLTNRHVACPWLDDPDIDKIIADASKRSEKIQFESRLLLWFDGQRAIKQISELSETDDLDQFMEDRYFVQNAYRSNGSPNVYIAGVQPSPWNLEQLRQSPLGDDVAFLKIDQPPKNLQPIRILNASITARPKPLTPVVVMGFPLGAQHIPGEEVLVSLTMGNVRRSFEGVAQIDASMHPGNSGGPVIDSNGNLIGIASAVASKQSLLDAQPLSDFGMVLPVNRALPLFKELRNGEHRWDGSVDYNIDQVRMELSGLVMQNKWSEAEDLIREEFKQTPDPQLLELQGALQYVSSRSADSEKSFLQLAAEMPSSDRFAKLMMLVLGNRPDANTTQPRDTELLSASWDSPYEFQGYLARIYRGQISESDALDGWENGSEKAFIHWVLAKRQVASGQIPQALNHLKTAVREAGFDTPEFLISVGELRALRSDLLPQLFPANRTELLKDKRIRRTHYVKSKFYAAINQAKEASKMVIYEDLYHADPEDSGLLLEIAFRRIFEGDWAAALADVEHYLSRKHRICANSLAGELLNAELLQLTGRNEEAASALQKIASSPDHLWYATIARDLLEPEKAVQVDKEAEKDSGRLVALEAARGLWAESKADKQSAIKHYRKALESYRSNWLEYLLALKRIEQLRAESTQ